MRLRLDENLPDEVRAAAAALGHDVDIVVDEELGGASDPDVLAAALRDDRFVITLDRGFGDVRRYPPGTHAGVAVLRVDWQDAQDLTLNRPGFRGGSEYRRNHGVHGKNEEVSV